MSFGFKNMDASGNILFSTDMRLLRVIHVERVLAGSALRDVSITGLRADRAWWITQADTSFRRGPVGAIFDGFLRVIGPITAGTSSSLSSDGYIIVVGYG